MPSADENVKKRCIKMNIKMNFKHILLPLLFIAGNCPAEAQDDNSRKQPEQAAKLEGSALDYMLQGPRVTKRYERKVFGDRLFLEGGAGFTTMPNRADKLKTSKPGILGDVAIGDWVSPEHGWRLGVNSGFYKLAGNKYKTVSLSVDYLLNITAVANAAYKERKRFEVFGVAGGNLLYSRHKGTTTHGIGLHLGLRGQYNFSKLTYIYLEPQVGLYQDKVFHMSNLQHFRPVGHLLAGLGYSLMTDPERSHDTYEHKNFWHDGTFVYFGLGPSALVTSNIRSLKHNLGMHAQLGIGKWFDPFNGLRLTAHASLYKGHPKKGDLIRGIGGRAEYMLNLHNVFGGPRTDRRFTVNAIGGLDFSYIRENGENRTRPGLGAALQGNFRLTKNADLIIEPRIDIYGNEYLKFGNTASKWDILPSLLAGFSFHNSTEISERRTKNATYKKNEWRGGYFVEAAGGLTMPAKPSSLKHPVDHVGPKAFVGFGKWFAPTMGVRLWAEAAKMMELSNRSSKVMGMGADFLWNITNTVHGYDADRPCELIAGAGIGGATHAGKKHLYFGGNASLKGLWHVSPLFGLYLEPQLRIFPDNYLKYSASSANLDFPIAIMLGGQLDLTGNYDRAAARQSFEEEGKSTFISFAAGTEVQANKMRTKSYYGWAGQFALGRWFSPVAAWRATLSGVKHKFNKRHSAEIMLGADYMLDLTAMTYGYRKDRPVRLIGFIGGALGADYLKDQKATFSPNLHFGGQLAIRTGSRTEVFAEPQLAYKMGTRYVQRLDHWHPSLLLGVTYNMKASEGNAARKETPKYRQFVNLGIGAGYHTLTATSMQPRNRKITFEVGAGYGRWVNGISGWHVAFHNSTLQTYGKGNRNVMAVQADYLVDLIAPFAQKSADERVFQLTATLGAGLYINQRKNEDTRFAPGVQGALQIGARVSPNVELYLEPAAEVYSKKILKPTNNHPAEGEVRMQLGTRFHF